MKGLIIKDFCNIMRQWKFWALYFVCMGIASVFSDNFSMTGIVVFVMPMIAMGAFSYDELTKWDRYALTMPVSRQKIVLARYSLCGIMLAGSAVAGTITIIASSLVHKHGVWNLEGMLTLYTIVAAAVLCCSLQIPIIYKLGPEKARIWTMLLFLVPFGGIFGIIAVLPSRSTEGSIVSSLNSLPWYWIFVGIGIIAVIATLISYQISFKIYSKKEF